MSTEIKTLRERLYEHCIFHPRSRCWIWTAVRNPKGYGQIGEKVSMSQWAIRQAHRASWIVHHGSIPNGMQVLHKCDRPSCINPEHLFLGTNADNSADKVAKGRHLPGICRGERSGRSKLTAEDVRNIRLMNGLSQQSLASMFGVSQAHISSIRLGKSWRHV